jgi:2-methylcitrate dehydratase PrpD
MLQTRDGKRTAQAEVRIAVDMVEERLISKREAVGRVKPEQIESIESGGSFKMLDMHEEKRPQSLMAGQYSLPFITALAFYSNLADPSVWDDRVLSRPEVLALAQKVNLHIDDDLEKISKETNDYAGIKMKVRLKNGREYSTQVRFSKGTLDNPATAEDIHDKFKVLASHALPAAGVKKVAGLIDRLEEMENVVELGKALMGKLVDRLIT